MQENLEIGIVNFFGQITDQHDNIWHSIFLKRRSRSVIFFFYSFFYNSFFYNFHKLLLGWYITKKLMIRQVVWGGNDLHQMFRAQSFEGWLVLTQGWILIQVSLFLCSRAYLNWFSLFFVEYPVIISWTKRIKPNFQFKAFQSTKSICRVVFRPCKSCDDF